jgi:hypothetical protein
MAKPAKPSLPPRALYTSRSEGKIGPKAKRRAKPKRKPVMR